ncbi:MAG TPA: hypothetical protein VKS82_17895 [Streptosporangiaceae bacterium]|nr:hypothetical protein [Streptosporangiaceae bacterium]
MDDLALAAASALMTAVATDAWSEVRAGVVNLWRRVHPERVPAIESELVDVRNEIVISRQAGDAEVEKELAADWRRKFQRLTQAHPELVPELRLLAEEWIRLAPAGQDRSVVANVEQTAIATGRGTVYQAGRDQRISGA